MSVATKAKTRALAGWFGAARMIAEHAGEALRGCSWVGIPAAGGMSELLHIKASTILVSDLHRHIINLALVIAKFRAQLQDELDRTPFHPDILLAAQEHCRWWEANFSPDAHGHMTPNFEAAKSYFLCCWMAHGGRAGTDKEFEGGMSVRWKATGGDSAIRLRSASESLSAWDSIMPRCTFVCLDLFEFLMEARERDLPENGLYIDVPWPEDGDGYKHKFTEVQQIGLSKVLAGFEKTRVVIRYGDHPLIRELYPETLWKWNLIEGRTQANKAKAEVLITRKAQP